MKFLTNKYTGVKVTPIFEDENYDSKNSSSAYEIVPSSTNKYTSSFCFKSKF